MDTPSRTRQLFRLVLLVLIATGVIIWADGSPILATCVWFGFALLAAEIEMRVSPGWERIMDVIRRDSRMY